MSVPPKCTEKKRLLISGASGFVGGHIMAAARSEWDVWATYRTHPFTFPDVAILSLDLDDHDAIDEAVERIRPHAIVHCAAWSDLDGCQADPDTAYRVNAEASQRIAELASAAGCRLVYTSTDMVFDGERGMYNEQDQTHPINVYGETKLAGESCIRKACPDSVIARLALVYGKPVTGSNSFSEKALARLQAGQEMTLFTDQFRTPVLVNELAQALLELAVSDFSGLIHLGGSERIDRYAFGLRLAELRGLPATRLRPVSARDYPQAAPRPVDVSLDNTLARSLLKTQLSGCRKGLRYA